jgi:hypothetical protein
MAGIDPVIEDSVRRYVVRLVRGCGIPAKLMAQAMGVSQYWLRRWMRQDPGHRPITADIATRLESKPARALLMDYVRARLRQLQIEMFPQTPTSPTRH